MKQIILNFQNPYSENFIKHVLSKKDVLPIGINLDSEANETTKELFEVHRLALNRISRSQNNNNTAVSTAPFFLEYKDDGKVNFKFNNEIISEYEFVTPENQEYTNRYFALEADFYKMVDDFFRDLESFLKKTPHEEEE